MVVVRNWSLVDLQRLYHLAEDEVAHPRDSPLPEDREMRQVEGDPRLSITAAAHEGNSCNAMVKYNVTPLSQLEASCDKAMYQPNRLLNAPDYNIVDRLLREWTRLYETDAKTKRANGYQAHVESDTDDSDSDDDSDYEYERPGSRGQYLEAPPRNAGVVKEVRFQPRVEDDVESDQGRPRRKGPRRGILRSVSEDSSSCSSDSDDLRASPRSSMSSTTSRMTPVNDPSGGSRRQTPAGIYGPPPGSAGPAGSSGNTGTQPGTQPGIPNHPRSGPPSPRMSRPVSIPNQPRAQLSSDQQAQQYPPRQYTPSIGPSYPPPHGNLYRTPPPTTAPPGPGRLGYGGYSPHGRANLFPPPPPPSQQQQQQQHAQPLPPPPPPPSLNSNPFPPLKSRSSRSEHRHSKSRSQRRERGDGRKESSFKENAKKDVKRGLLGAGAVAGLMDILEGLSAI